MPCNRSFVTSGYLIVSGQPLAWARDGTALYFVGFSKNDVSVWMITVDPKTLAITGGPDRLTTIGLNLNITLSQDGLRIAYAFPSPNMRVWLYALDASGRRIAGTPQALTPPEIFAPMADLTADGMKLLYGAYRQGSRANGELRELSIPDGSDRLLLSSDAARGEARTFQRWSPDGLRIAYPTSRPARRPHQTGAQRGQ